MLTRLSLAVALALVAVPVLAHADIAPPPGYVEKCTVEKACTAEEDGDACRTYFKERDKCDKLHATDGFVRRCKTRGASVWTEVWCRPKKAAKPDDKKPENTKTEK